MCGRGCLYVSMCVRVGAHACFYACACVRELSTEPAKVYRSIVTDIFGGVTQSSVSCNACDQSSKQCEPFLDLSISLPGMHAANAN